MDADKRRIVRRTSFPQLWLLVPLCSGLWLGRTFTDLLSPWQGWLVVASGLLLLLSLLLHLQRRKAVRFVATACFVLALAGGGALLMTAEIGRVRTSWPQTPQDYAVRVISLPKPSARSMGVEAEILRGEFAGKRIRLNLPDSVQPRVGDAFWIHAQINSPKPSGNPYSFNWADYLLTQGVGGTAYTPYCVRMSQAEQPFSLRVWALTVQEASVEKLQSHFEGTEFAMLSAMTVGDKRGLTQTVRQVFSETGTSHLLALSGLHLGILFGIYQFLFLKRLRRRGYRFAAVGIGLVLVWLFALVAGMPISLQRAATMLSLMQLMQLSRRDTQGMDRLFVSAILILLMSPLALFDVGFQLSFLSVASILLVVPLFPTLSMERNGIVHGLYSSLLATLTAWIGTMPVVAYYFHTISVYSLPANMIVVALALPLLLLCLLFLVLPVLTSFLAVCIKGVLGAMTASLSFFADLPGSTIQLFPTALGTWLALAALLALWWGIERRSRGMATAFVLLTCALIAEETWAHRPGRLQTQIVFYNLWRGSAIQAIRADGVSYLWTHGEDAPEEVRTTAREFWLQENVEPSFWLSVPRRDSLLYFSPPLLSFCGKRVALLCAKQARDFSSVATTDSVAGPNTSPAIPVDYILVARGYSGKPAASLRRYSQGLIVLDSSLGSGYRRLWHAAADSLHRPVYDMESQGALVVRIGEE